MLTEERSSTPLHVLARIRAMRDIHVLCERPKPVAYSEQFNSVCNSRSTRDTSFNFK